ncbi:MAG TPA: UdgX family uracil-DNA binding protein [Jatrophihabitans sp.]|jgi:DNA polymerase
MAQRIEHPGASAYLPDASGAGLDELAVAVQHCRGCNLYEDATQAVFGTGLRHARIMLVGEQPGDVEDRAGAPFVGPAGGVLDDALGEAGLARADVYLTNAVKHFRWRTSPRGKRRIHERPTTGQMVACRPWLEAEFTAVQPSLVVALGATAVSSLFGPSVGLTASRGRELRWHDCPAVATIHPSAVLRVPDSDDRAETYRGLVDDLRSAQTLLET